jgi:hypothetical protein
VEELPDSLAQAGAAFASVPPPADVPAARGAVITTHRNLGAFEDGEPFGPAGVEPPTLTVPGGRVPAAGTCGTRCRRRSCAVVPVPLLTIR